MRLIISLPFIALTIALTFASPSQAADLQKIEIGYMPNLWWEQPYVIKGMGWDHEAGLDLVLRYWLENAFEDYEQYVQVINTGSQDQSQHSIISGDVDAAAVFQPLWAVSKHKAPELEIFAEPHELMKDQPGGVLFVRQTFWDEHPDAVKEYMALHIRATQLMRENSKEASKHIHNYLSQGLIPIEITEEAVEFTTDRFADNANVMISPTKVIQQLMLRDGYLRKSIDVDRLYETELYDATIKLEEQE